MSATLRSTTALCTAACAAIVWMAVPARAAAQQTPFVEVSGDLSPVTIGTHDTTWQVARLAGGVRDEGRFGWTVGTDRQRRGSLVDWSVQGGGFRHLGDWTVSGTAGFSDRPDFLYRRSFEGELARRVVGGLVLHGGYRHLTFPATEVRLVQPAVSWYFARGDVQARGFFGHNTATGRDSSTLLLRGGVDVAPRVRVGGGVAVGTRIFDVAALQDQRADAWVAFATASVRLAPQWTLTAGAGGAHEDPLFSQRTVTLGLRWALR